jgi:hypothetical protein
MPSRRSKQKKRDAANAAASKAAEGHGGDEKMPLPSISNLPQKYYFAREGDKIVPKDPSFVQMLGFPVEMYYTLRKIFDTPKSMKLITKQVMDENDLLKDKDKQSNQQIEAEAIKRHRTKVMGELGEIFNPAHVRRASLTIKHGNGFSVRNDLLAQIPVSIMKELQDLFHKTDTNGNRSIDREEFYVAYKEEYGLSRASSDAEFNRIDTNHDGELDFNEFCENMAPRLLTKTNWKAEDLHQKPTDPVAILQLEARKIAYALCCCCFVVEGVACVWEVCLRPCWRELEQSCAMCMGVHGISIPCRGYSRKKHDTIHVESASPHHDPLSVPAVNHEFVFGGPRYGAKGGAAVVAGFSSGQTSPKAAPITHHIPDR